MSIEDFYSSENYYAVPMKVLGFPPGCEFKTLSDIENEDEGAENVEEIPSELENALSSLRDYWFFAYDEDEDFTVYDLEQIIDPDYDMLEVVAPYGEQGNYVVYRSKKEMVAIHKEFSTFPLFSTLPIDEFSLLVKDRGSLWEIFFDPTWEFVKEDILPQ